MSGNPLDSGCLRPFDVVAHHRNLSRAAAALGMTQPALSYRIRQMEDVLGVQLFRRRPRGLELTSEGETLQTAVRQGLRSEEHTSELQSLMRISYAVSCLTKHIIVLTCLTSTSQCNKHASRSSALYTFIG